MGLYDIVEDPSESNNLANIHPELVIKLLKEAEEIIKDAPKQEFGLLNSKTVPKAPVFYSSFWSSLPTLQSPLGRSFSAREEEVIPLGLYLDDDVDLGGPLVVYEASQLDVLISQMIRTYGTLFFVLMILPGLVIKLVR